LYVHSFQRTRGRQVRATHVDAATRLGRRAAVAARTALEPHPVAGPRHVAPEVGDGRDSVAAAAAVRARVTVDVVVDERRCRRRLRSLAVHEQSVELGRRVHRADNKK